MADDIRQWLERLGLGKYCEVFAENEIDFDTLPRLDTEDLKELGLPIGPVRHQNIWASECLRKRGLGSSWFDVKRLVGDATSGGFGWLVF